MACAVTAVLCHVGALHIPPPWHNSCCCCCCHRQSQRFAAPAACFTFTACVTQAHLPLAALCGPSSVPGLCRMAWITSVARNCSQNEVTARNPATTTSCSNHAQHLAGTATTSPFMPTGSSKLSSNSLNVATTVSKCATALSIVGNLSEIQLEPHSSEHI